MSTSQEIRDVLRISGIKNTEVAKNLGISKDWIGTLLRRDELDVEHTIRILDATSEILQKRYTDVEAAMVRVDQMYKELEG